MLAETLMTGQKKACAQERTASMIRLGLERMAALMAALEARPQGHSRLATTTSTTTSTSTSAFHMDRLPPVVHIAGTNGKGSISAMLDAALHHGSAWQTMRFNSPHLVVPRDALKVNGKTVGLELWHACQGAVEEVRRCRGTDGEDPVSLATPFEITTAQMLLALAASLPDLAILETGLGGRLDATNIVPRKVLAIISAIDLDHQAFLGPTIEAIAEQKAGIITAKTEVCLLAPQRHLAATRVVEERCRQMKVPLVRVESNQEVQVEWLGDPQEQMASVVLGDETGEMRLPLAGAYQLDNVKTVLAALAVLRKQTSLAATLRERITLEKMLRGLETTRWPGRLEHRRLKGRQFLLDGAHNPSAARELRAHVDGLVRRNGIRQIDWLFASSRHDDDLVALAHALFATTGSAATERTRYMCYAFSPPEGMPWVKAATTDEIQEAGRALGRSFEPIPSLLADSFPTDDARLTVLCGSLYLVGDFYRQNDLEKD